MTAAVTVAARASRPQSLHLGAVAGLTFLVLVGGGLVLTTTTTGSTAAPNAGQSQVGESGAAKPVADLLRDADAIDPALADEVTGVTVNQSGWLLMVARADTQRERAAELCAALRAAEALTSAPTFVVDANHELIQAC